MQEKFPQNSLFETFCWKSRQNFRISISSNYSQNSDKIFSKLIVLLIIFPTFAENFRLHNGFLKLFRKYMKNFLKIACFKNFLIFL